MGTAPGPPHRPAGSRGQGKRWPPLLACASLFLGMAGFIPHLLLLDHVHFDSGLEQVFPATCCLMFLAPLAPLLGLVFGIVAVCLTRKDRGQLGFEAAVMGTFLSGAALLLCVLEILYFALPLIS
jgi:hypothetical protein